MAPNNLSDDIQNPNLHLNIPRWINEDYFQNILKKDVPNYAKIINFKPVAATAPGENYTSIMIRVFIDVQKTDGSTEKVSYILKTALEGEAGGAFVDSMGLFPKEKKMYETILPAYEKLYAEAGADIKLSARCLQVQATPEHITLVLEDLKRRNFKNQDRLKGLDMAHLKRVLRKLAELHAASAVYYERNGPYEEMFQQSFFSEKNRPLFLAMGAARDELFKKAMREEWGLKDPEYYLKKMPEVNVYFDECMRLNEHDPQEFNVLNHGDCWLNNMMFNYKPNGDIDEMLFVDYQVGKWGTPAQDLWYLILTSAALDIKIKEFDHFVQIYHERLMECLQLLKYTKHIPTLKDLHIMMLKYGNWGFMTTCGVLCAILLPSDKDANMEMMLKPGPDGDAARYKTFINPYYIKAAVQAFEFLNNKGILDIFIEN